jgi:hypothetical protein
MGFGTNEEWLRRVYTDPDGGDPPVLYSAPGIGR